MSSLSDLLLQPSISPRPGDTMLRHMVMRPSPGRKNAVAQALARGKEYRGTGPRPGETIPWHKYVTRYRRFHYGTYYA
ncbi:hypothetical protein CsSME_00024963 [Camellia sinensis var. sinensis]